MLKAMQKIKELVKTWETMPTAADYEWRGLKPEELDIKQDNWVGQLKDAIKELDEAISQAGDNTELYKIGGRPSTEREDAAGSQAINDYISGVAQLVGVE